jgi:AcrR family transcriptional regulator
VPGGRPRTFDEKQALDRAVEVFWRHGYEGTSLADLTAAMGVNKPSLYAVFGSKEELFHRAVQRYAERDMAYVRTALAEPTAYQVTQTFLLENARALTRRDRPAGCLTIQGGLSCGTDNSGICAFLAASRHAGERALADRFRVALAEGDLPADADADALARYISTVSEGQAVHAAAGATLAELQQTVDMAVRCFPTGSTT